ncbi:MAG: RluA family pseudouridine synthase [Myxococcales bacterium]|jgi:23S rRNA pseudouridine1911/1915/1917 synthase|nr:RluA family pseudouridine synthase [Myxococcales bacterium]
MKRLHTVPDTAAPGARVDRYLSDELQISRAKLKALFEAGLVRIDGRRVPKGALVPPGARIEIELPDEPTQGALQPEPEQPLAVLYEDTALVVLDKPAGVPAHALDASDRGSLAGALIARYPECAWASPDAPFEGGIAHRLDTETSGVILAARTPQTYQALRERFACRRIEKRYAALVGGLPTERGEIALPIAHHPTDPKRMVACADEALQARLKAREALTRYTLQAWHADDFALLDVEIPTGVRHQIRVHLASIGAPIAGDRLYGGPAIDGLERHFLHARHIALDHPSTGKRIEIEAPLPRDLTDVLERLAHGATR